MKALESKMIEVVDGGSISGKQKSGEKIGGITDPNAQILLYAQPETIREYLHDSIVDSGLLGRFMVHIPEPTKDHPFKDAFLRRSKDQKELPEDFIRYFTQQQQKNPEKHELAPTDEDLDKLQEWMIEKIFPLAETEQHIKLLKRLAISAEQLYIVILGTMRHWDFINEREPRESFDVSIMFPLLQYWAECKAYCLQEFIDESMDPLADAIKDIVAALVLGKIKSQRSTTVKKHNAVPRSEIYRVIQSRTKLKKQLDSRGDMRNIRMRIEQLIDMWLKTGELVEVENTIGKSKNKLIGFSQDHIEKQ
jgi:hypothetical protein